MDATLRLTRFLDPSVRQLLVAELFDDVQRYFLLHSFASHVRKRLLTVLVPALRRRERVLLIAHSFGSIVAYDVLWMLSHLREYTSLHDRRVDTFVTLGSPLGDKVVKGHLLGWKYPLAQRYPANIRRWCNLSARGDVIAHDARVAGDFRPMRTHTPLERFEEYANLCTVYRGRDGAWNPHKLYGYLILPELGRLIATTLRSSMR